MSLSKKIILIGILSAVSLVAQGVSNNEKLNVTVVTAVSEDSDPQEKPRIFEVSFSGKEAEFLFEKSGVLTPPDDCTTISYKKTGHFTCEKIQINISQDVYQYNCYLKFNLDGSVDESIRTPKDCLPPPPSVIGVSGGSKSLIFDSHLEILDINQIPLLDNLKTAENWENSLFDQITIFLSTNDAR